MRYRFEIKQGEHVLRLIEDVSLPDPAAAWGFIDELANEIGGSGLRVVVKDAEGNVVIMAGLVAPARSTGDSAA